MDPFCFFKAVESITNGLGKLTIQLSTLLSKPGFILYSLPFSRRNSVGKVEREQMNKLNYFFVPVLTVLVDFTSPALVLLATVVVTLTCKVLLRKFSELET